MPNMNNVEHHKYVTVVIMNVLTYCLLLGTVWFICTKYPKLLLDNAKDIVPGCKKVNKHYFPV